MLDLAPGEVVHVRSRQYLVEDVVEPPKPGDSPLVRLSCLEDDALGEALEVLWDKEIDARKLGDPWKSIAHRGFDDPKLFSAYLHTLRWNCVTATDAKLFQAPYRAGIEVKSYQLEPLRKALLLPRVNLFIADDVGLGKTIEAGLILRELLMRQKVRRVVICCPPSVVRQWHEEMDQRFGLSFVIYDRDYVAARRRERGYGINPWTTHNRFIISHALIRDEAYAGSLRDWLGEFSGGALLILDEAHNAAPASRSRYAIDSKLTQCIRDLAPRFEHRLFLSATPHNGHSNSFAALLEILDPQRFCRGVPVKTPSLLEAVMVRRLKKDLRGLVDDFPDRKVVPIVITGLNEDEPELKLSRLLQAYRKAKEERLAGEPASKRASAMLVVISLQKRLLSSIEAFARTLAVHQKAMEAPPADVGQISEQLLLEQPGGDDERAELAEEEVLSEEEFALRSATGRSLGTHEAMAEELALLREMRDIAQPARYQRDSRLRWLVAWLRENLCPARQWLPRRVLIFTDYADTKRWLLEQLQAEFAASDRASERIDTFHGGMGDDRREDIKKAFNQDPETHPLRILIATDAAREGVNLQNYCADLFHFDIPWNPSKMEQRNGRIDRKLQRSPEVRCHYFVVQQRAEDRVLAVLVEKTKTIHDELGSLPSVVEQRVSKLLEKGIRAEDESQLLLRFHHLDEDDTNAGSGLSVVREELEDVRRQQNLAQQLEMLQGYLHTSQAWLAIDDRHFRDAISESLRLAGAEPIRPVDAAAALQDPSAARWEVPALDRRLGAAPTWSTTLDSLRAPPKRGQKLWEWRKEAPLRPIVFRDAGSLDGAVVHLHLEHRLVRRLLGRFLSQGFLHHELSRACVLRTDDASPKVLALGRLSLFGTGAARLHDELVWVAAEWTEPDLRGRAGLKPLNQALKKDVWELLEEALATPRLQAIADHAKTHLLACLPQDVQELAPALAAEAEKLAERATRQLARRGEVEGKQMRVLLEGQRDRIHRQQSKVADKLWGQQHLAFYDEEERRQLRADQKWWETRLQKLEGELDTEPARIQQAYEVRSQRIEPVGWVYLWPVSR